MNNRNVITIALFVLVMLNLALTGYILVRPSGDGPPHRRVDKLIIEKLQLTEEQVGAFQNLKADHHGRVRLCQDSIRILKGELMAALKLKTPDPVRANETAKKIGKLQEKIELITFGHFEDLRTLCKGDQERLFEQFIGEIARALDHPPGPGKNHAP